MQEYHLKDGKPKKKKKKSGDECNILNSKLFLSTLKYKN